MSEPAPDLEAALAEALVRELCNCPSRGEHPHSVHCWALQQTRAHDGQPKRLIDHAAAAVLPLLRQARAERPAAELTPAQLGETRLAKAAYRCNTRAAWAKEQLRVLGEMAADRAERPEAFQPLAPSFLTAELERIRSGMDLLAEGLLTEPLGADCEPTPAPASDRRRRTPRVPKPDIAPAALSALAPLLLAAGERERELRKALRWLLHLLHGAGKAGEAPEPGEHEAAGAAAEAALAAQPSPAAEAVAALAKLPGDWIQQAASWSEHFDQEPLDEDRNERARCSGELRAALARCGIGGGS